MAARTSGVRRRATRSSQRQVGDLLVGPVVGEGVRDRLEADHERRRLARHLGHQPGAAPVGGHAAVDPLAPQVGREVGLEHLVGHRHAGADRDLRHPGELVVEVPHVAGHREDPVPGLAQRLADGDELVGRRRWCRPPARRPWPGAGSSGWSTRRWRRPGRPRGRAPPSRRSPRRWRRRWPGPRRARRRAARRAGRGDATSSTRSVRSTSSRYSPKVSQFQFMPSASAVPGMSSTPSISWISQARSDRAGRGEPDAAVAHDDGGHPVPARRRDLRVPGGLAVVVGVDVDPARRDEEAVGVDDAAGRAVDLADGGDDAAVDGDVAGPGRAPRSVGDGAAPDDQVVHGAPLGVGARDPVGGYTQLRSFSIMATGSEPDRRHVEVGHARLGQGRHPLLDVGLGAAERRRLEQLGRHQRRRLLLLARQVEVLDLGGLLLVAVAAGQRVVEVPAPWRPCRRCRGRHRRGPARGSAPPRTRSPMARRPPAAICSGSSEGSRLAAPAAERRPEDLLDLVGDEEDRQPAVGHLGRHGDVLLAQRGDPDRDARAHRVVDDLERLAEPGPLAGRQRDVVRGAVVGERRLAGPDVAADLDDLAGAARAGGRRARRGSPRSPGGPTRPARGWQRPPETASMPAAVMAISVGVRL